MRTSRKGKLWEYLDSTGVLLNGSEADIQAVKRTYRKKYLLEYKKRQRATRAEFTVVLSKSTGEYGTITQAAKKHHISVTSFLRKATLAYIQQVYLVPNTSQIAELEQLLANCLNEIKTIVKGRERTFWDRDKKLDEIEKRIQRMEAQLNEVLRNPPLISSNDRKNKIA